MGTSDGNDFSAQIKKYAESLGFDLCGIARARSLDEYRPILTEWAVAGMNADMAYLGQNITKRIDPRILLPGAKSVIVTGLSYNCRKIQGGNGVPVISRYAYGNNYHSVILKKLNKLLGFIRTIHPDVAGKAFVDSAPLLEKVWAREAGLGYPGKHSVLINKELGTFFFLGVIVLNLELGYDKPQEKDYCGSCNLCIDSCPTGAINGNSTIDCRKCIAFHTLESKTQIPENIVINLEGRAFGCDKCQEVCPWNNHAKPHHTPEFDLPEEVAHMTADDWKNLSRKDYKRLFKDSAILRRSYCRFMDNIEAALKSLDS